MMVSSQSADARSKALIEVVERDRDKRCAEIIEEARSEAQRIVKQARSRARARVHLEVLETRENFRHQLLLAQANLETRRRQARQQEDRLLLEQAWQQLNNSLSRRWQQADTRQAWVAALIAQARKQLVNSSWRVEYSPDWPEAERRAVETRLAQELETVPEFIAEPTLPAGIRVHAGNSVVDGSCAGLLRNRARIEARLLAEIRRPENA